MGSSICPFQGAIEREIKNYTCEKIKF